MDKRKSGSRAGHLSPLLQEMKKMHEDLAKQDSTLKPCDLCGREATLIEGACKYCSERYGLIRK